MVSHILPGGPALCRSVTGAALPLGRRQVLAGMAAAGLLPGIAHAKGATLPLQPWTIRIGGMVQQPQTLRLDRLLAAMPLETHLCRTATGDGCALSRPWTGFALAHLVRLARPLPGARFVRFTSYVAPGDGPPALPHREGLHLNEAMHPLTMLAAGLGGEPLTAADGGPLRLVAPWEYGYKSAGSLVAVDFVRHPPLTIRLEKRV